MLTTSISPEITIALPQAGAAKRQPANAPAPSWADGPPQLFDAKEHVFCEGDPAGHVYKVEAGNVCIYKMLQDGRRQVIDFAFPGDLIGLGAVGEHLTNAQAISRTRLRPIPVKALHRAVGEDSRLGLKLLEILSYDLQASQELIVTLGQRSAEERFASFLQALSRRNQRNGENPSEFVLPMTRTDIGDFLGLTIETVSRTFTKLKSIGLIEIDQGTTIRIIDNEQLKVLADGQVGF